jgi:digeranylgeranylglycerophospholipid reductase
MDAYDVVVAGGGPAGLQFAREVARRTDRSVAVLEANGALSDNDKSTGGTFQELLERFDVPESVVMSHNDGILLEGPTERSRFDIDNCVLDFPAFLEFLGRDAADHGAEIHTRTRVTGAVVEDGGVVGVDCRTPDGDERVRAEVVVDATGPAGVLTTELDMWDRRAAQRGVAKEFEARGRYDLDSLLFRFDHDVAPGGYAWTFPAGEDVFKIGVCWIDDFRPAHVDNGDGEGDGDGTIDEYIRSWAAEDPRWEIEEVRAVHAGEARSDNSINQRATDGLVAVGDAVSSINPVFGEGIRPGMASAAMAADTVIDALERGDVSREALAAYERRWNRERGQAWRTQRMVGELLYDFSPAQQDGFVRRAGALSEPQLRRFQQYELTLRDLLGLYPPALKDLRKLPTLLRHAR